MTLDEYTKRLWPKLSVTDRIVLYTPYDDINVILVDRDKFGEYKEEVTRIGIANSKDPNFPFKFMMIRYLDHIYEMLFDAIVLANKYAQDVDGDELYRHLCYTNRETFDSDSKRFIPIFTWMKGIERSKIEASNASNMFGGFLGNSAAQSKSNIDSHLYENDKFAHPYMYYIDETICEDKVAIIDTRNAHTNTFTLFEKTNYRMFAKKDLRILHRYITNVARAYRYYAREVVAFNLRDCACLMEMED